MAVAKQDVNIVHKTLAQLIRKGEIADALALIKSKTIYLNKIYFTKTDDDKDIHDTALLVAVEGGHVEVVNALIQNDVDVNAVCEEFTALEHGLNYLFFDTSIEQGSPFEANLYKILVALLKVPHIKMPQVGINDMQKSQVNFLTKIIEFSYPEILSDFQALVRAEHDKSAATEPSGLYLSDKAQSASTSSLRNAQGTLLFNLHNDAGQEFDLLGTAHILPFDKLPKALQERCQKKSVLATEVLSLSESMMDIFLGIVQKFKGDTLVNEYDRLSDKTRSKIEAILEQNSYGKILKPKLKDYKLWVILMLLRYLQQLSQAPAQLECMDETLRLFFVRQSRQVWNLETYADRVEANNYPQLSFAECENGINALLDSQNEKNEKEEQEIQEICNAYLTGNIQKIFALDNGIEDYAGISARNKKWLPKIVQNLKQNSGQLLVAGGAMHLLGQDGLLSLFAKEGFKIKRCQADGKFIAYDVSADFPAKPALTAPVKKKKKKHKKKAHKK